jgi:hypothetical protein
LWTICLGWLWTVILLIAASWVAARIVCVSHPRPATSLFKFFFLFFETSESFIKVRKQE